MLMLGESSIREVIAFPKNQNAQCLMSERREIFPKNSWRNCQ